MTGQRALSVCVVALWIAGCTDTGSSTSGPVATVEAQVDDETGGLEGVVTDDSFVPLVGAVVGLIDRPDQPSTRTDEGGRFALSKIAPGPAQVAVQALGYETYTTRVEIAAGEVREVNAMLVKLAIVEPYHATVSKKGRIFCGTHVRPVVAFAACGAVYGTPLSSLDSFVVPFELQGQNLSAVKALVFESQWTPTQVLGSGLNVRWETFTDITPAYTFTEPVRTFAVAIGKSPLWTIADEDTIKSNVTRHKPPPTHCKPIGPCKFWARVFPYANTLGPSYPADVAFYVDQAYTHYASEFYGEPPPAVFTALADK